MSAILTHIAIRRQWRSLSLMRWERERWDCRFFCFHGLLGFSLLSSFISVTVYECFSLYVLGDITLLLIDERPSHYFLLLYDIFFFAIISRCPPLLLLFYLNFQSLLLITFCFSRFLLYFLIFIYDMRGDITYIFALHITMLSLRALHRRVIFCHAII